MIFILEVKIISNNIQNADILLGNKDIRSKKLKNKILTQINKLSTNDIMKIEENLPQIYIKEFDNSNTFIKGMYDWRFNLIIINQQFYNTCINKKFYYQIFECVQHEFIHYIIHILYFQTDLELYENEYYIQLNEQFAQNYQIPGQLPTAYRSGGL